MSDNTRLPPALDRAYQDDEINLLALAGRLWDAKYLIALVTVLFIVVGGIRAMLTAPVFRANAIVQVEKKASAVPGMAEMSEMFGNESSAVTEIELLKSRKVIGAAVEALKLDVVAQPRYFPVVGQAVARYSTPGRRNAVNQQIEEDASGLSRLLGLSDYAWGGEGISVERFEVPEGRFGAAHTLVTQGDGAYTLLSPQGEAILQGKVAKSAAADGYELYVSSLQAAPGTQFLLTRNRMLNTVLAYQGALGASERGRDSGIIELSIEDTNPHKAVKVLDEIAQAYVRQNVERQSAEAAKSLAFLRAQLPGIKKELEQAERKLNNYQVKAGSVNISAEAEVLLEQMVDIESALTELELQRAELDRKYTPDHPAYKAWQEQLADRRARKAELDARVKKLPSTQQELFGLRRAMEVGTEIYTQMLNNIQELDIVRAGTVGNVRIVDDAVVKTWAPVKPKKRSIIVLSAILGLMAGVGLVLLRAALNRGIENPEDIENIGLPVYASIPLSDQQRRLDSQRAEKRKRRRLSHPNDLLAQHNPTDIAIESLRSLRTSLHFAMLETPNNIMMVTGPSPAVGKSFVSGNLAAVIAQAGQRVLLIDMDLRKGYMHHMFGLSHHNGVADVLSKRCSVEESIKPTGVNELYFMPRGTAPPNPSELLMSEGLTTLLASVQEQFDLIIVDTPPVMAVTDAAIVGRHCGVTMLVTRFGLNPIKELEVTKRRLEQNGIAVKGVVFNAVERRASAYGYGYGKYGYYHYEYKTDEEKA